MESLRAAILPYRTDAEDLARWLEARARGRNPAQIRSLDFGAKAYEGTLAAAQALGFVEPQGTELNEAGRAYALARPEARPALLQAAMMAYEAYGLLLEAVFARGAAQPTETAWIEAWWATHGYGASATNRAEGAVAFARLADFAGLGSYVQGRRGRPSRIEWTRHGAQAGEATPAAPWGDLWSAAPPAAAPATRGPGGGRTAAPSPGVEVERGVAGAGGAAPARAVRGEPPAAPVGRGEAHHQAVIELGGGRVVSLRVPVELSEAEKTRLLELFSLLLDARGR